VYSSNNFLIFSNWFYLVILFYGYWMYCIVADMFSDILVWYINKHHGIKCIIVNTVFKITQIVILFSPYTCIVYTSTGDFM